MESGVLGNALDGGKYCQSHFPCPVLKNLWRHAAQGNVYHSIRYTVDPYPLSTYCGLPAECTIEGQKKTHIDDVFL